MIGIIVTGHGNFATGLTSGLKLLAGETEAYEAVDFEPEDSIDLLTEKLKNALEQLSHCEQIAVFADLTGGSPFNVAARLKMGGTICPMEVSGGTNLPVVLQAYLSRSMYPDAKSLMDSALEDGKKQMVRFVPEHTGSDDECEEYEE